MEPVGRSERDRGTLMRFMTCGSVDDGKSTLIGRLLYESKHLYADHLAALERDSRKFGTTGGDLDFALLLDGLDAERQQGITIDVAYRYFSSRRRHFIVADAPGHEQYTRNMVTAASTADLAVLLVDARKGLLRQTRRHACVVALLGVRHVVLAVNKIDLVGYSQATFDAIARDFDAFARSVGIAEATSIPVSALVGDNIVAPGVRTPWYRGPTLMEHLDTVAIADPARDSALRMPVQWVARPDSEFRGFAGRIAGGSVAPGDRVCVALSGRESHVARIVTMDGDLDRAVAGQSVMLVLEDGIDVGRGDVVADAQHPPGVADQFEAAIIWMSEQPLLPGRPYLVKIATTTVGATIATLKYEINVDTQEHLAAATLRQNSIGVCNVHLDAAVAFDPYAESRTMGGFILIDRMTGDTAGAGLIRFALRRAHNIGWQAIEVDKAAHAAQKAQKPCIVWFTGISAAGKSTIANIVERKLHALGRHTYLLDGDNLRHGLNLDLGFTDADRVENVRRVAEVARLMADAGLIVLVSLISPFRAERQFARERVEDGEFCEVHVDTALAVAERRDPKGLYAKARRGELANFTGIDSPYEPPASPEVRIDTEASSPEEAAGLVIAQLRAMGAF